MGSLTQGYDSRDFTLALIDLGLPETTAADLAPELTTRVRYEELKGDLIDRVSGVQLFLPPGFFVAGVVLLQSHEADSFLGWTLVLSGTGVVASLAYMLWQYGAGLIQPLGRTVQVLTETLHVLHLLRGDVPEQAIGLTRHVTRMYRWSESTYRNTPSTFSTVAARDWQLAHRVSAASEIGVLEREIHMGRASPSAHHQVFVSLLARLVLDLWPAQTPDIEMSRLREVTQPLIATAGRRAAIVVGGLSSLVTLIASLQAAS